MTLKCLLFGHEIQDRKVNVQPDGRYKPVEMCARCGKIEYWPHAGEWAIDSQEQ